MLLKIQYTDWFIVVRSHPCWFESLQYFNNFRRTQFISFSVPRDRVIALKIVAIVEICFA